MSFAITATAVGVVGAGVGIASQAGAFTPGQPNLSASSAEMANVQAGLLPAERKLQAQAELGGTVLLPGYTMSGDAAQERASLESQIAQIQSQRSAAGSAGLRGQGFSDNKLAQLQAQLKNLPESGQVYRDSKGNIVSASQAVADFTGKGTADIQGDIMNQLVKGQLANRAEFDPQFIDQALKQEQEANPQQGIARSAMYDMIQHQIQNPPQSPVADEMGRQVGERVAAGSGLTPEEQAMLDQAVNQGTAARGDTAGPDFSRLLTTGSAGTARELNNAKAGAAWLGSGQTPGDLQFRSEQQNIGNLADYISGKTPQSQFNELSGAQVGATPNYQSASLPGIDQNAGEVGANAAITNYGQQVSQAQNTVSPWTTGVSAAIGLGKTLGSAGWKPLS